MEMQQYMMSELSIKDKCMVDIICTAPISLNVKMELLENLYRKIKHKRSDIWKAYCDIHAAIDVLGKKGVYDECIFYLFAEWYDTEVFVEKSSGAGMFKNISDIIRYIQNEERENDSDEGWYRIEAWTDVEGELSLIYNFYTFKDEVCWFEKMTPYDEIGNVYYRHGKGYYGVRLLANGIETPFKTGDIVSIDCRPFGPPFNAMILEDRHQFDSSFPTLLYKVPYTEEWRVSSLKWGLFFKCAEGGGYCSPLSALYRLRLAEDEELQEFSQKLLGDSKKGEKIWELWKGIESKHNTIEDVRKVFESV